MPPSGYGATSRVKRIRDTAPHRGHVSMIGGCESGVLRRDPRNQHRLHRSIRVFAACLAVAHLSMIDPIPSVLLIHSAATARLYNGPAPLPSRSQSRSPAGSCTTRDIWPSCLQRHSDAARKDAAPMAPLESLTHGARARGLVGAHLATVMDAQWFGHQAIELTY